MTSEVWESHIQRVMGLKSSRSKTTYGNPSPSAIKGSIGMFAFIHGCCLIASPRQMRDRRPYGVVHGNNVKVTEAALYETSEMQTFEILPY
jgi:hypothetical protein